MSSCTPGSPMRRALELMWESYCVGSFPVGAVLTDPSGTVVVEGRNHAGETRAAAGLMRATTIAHAEMSVLAQLAPGDYDQHTLWTTLEPCVLCQAATLMSHVGHVVYLAHDPICLGLDALPAINVHAGRRYPTMTGPGDGAEARFAAILPMAVLFVGAPTGWAVSHYRQHAPGDAAVAERIARDGLWPAQDTTVDEAIEAITTLL